MRGGWWMTFAGSERKEPSAMDMGLRNAAVFVTGGNRGIGRAIAIGFAQEGARVANCGRDGDALDETHKAIEAMGGAVCDAADKPLRGRCVREGRATHLRRVLRPGLLTPTLN